MNIQDFPALKAQLSNEKLAKIMIHTTGPYQPSSARERSVTNPHTERLSGISLSDDSGVDDIVNGSCRAEQSSDGDLKRSYVFALLASSKRISTPYIMKTLGLTERQARRYMAACKLAIQQLTRHFNSLEVATVPRTRALTLAEIRAAHKKEANGNSS
ncbi:MAG: hypothetical protein DI616_16075 [Paracoccus denitrificans]|uniref:Uncharacterized protein n=1 Tax=Paracoccus denitrificans TaxID=266 RepID=A0A533I3K8_PARDE|nr:MAG: hypothetical protein DI616_16075 [Paracoccus denitrificans]